MPHLPSPRFHHWRSGVCLALFVLAFVPGCGSDELDSPTAKKLKALSGLYLDYAVARNGQGPANEEAFKKYMRGVPDQVFAPHGFPRSEIDSMFVSERDQEPMVVVYGLKITGISGKSGAVIAHEKTGKSGKRLVVLSNGKVEHVDESELRGLLAVQP